MPFEKIIKTATDGCLSRIEAEHAALLDEAVKTAVAKQAKELKERIERQQVALNAAAKEIERGKARLDKVKNELKANAVSFNERMEDMEKKNAFLQRNLDTAKAKLRRFDK